MPTDLVFDGLTKRFGPTLAVDRLSAKVRPGVVTAFLGPNGAGKTTTLRMLLGLVRPSAGHATFNGKRYDELADPVREVGAMLDATGFHPGRSGLNHLRCVAVAAKLDAGRPREVLEVVGLTSDAHRKVGQYSLGMRQRLGLATALLGDPTVLVLDEPANGLDPQGIRWLRTFLRELARQGRTVLVSSHFLPEVEQTADDVLVLAHGRLVRQTSLDELRAEHRAGTVVRSPCVGLEGVLSAAGYIVRRTGDDELLVHASPPVVGELAADHGIVLHALAETSGGLEDAFLSLTEEVAL